MKCPTWTLATIKGTISNGHLDVMGVATPHGRKSAVLTMAPFNGSHSPSRCAIGPAATSMMFSLTCFYQQIITNQVMILQRKCRFQPPSWTHLPCTNKNLGLQLECSYSLSRERSAEKTCWCRDGERPLLIIIHYLRAIAQAMLFWCPLWRWFI